MTPYQFATMYKDRKVRIADNPLYADEVRGLEGVIEGTMHDELILIRARGETYAIPMKSLTLLQDGPLPLPG